MHEEHENDKINKIYKLYDNSFVDYIENNHDENYDKKFNSFLSKVQSAKGHYFIITPNEIAESKNSQEIFTCFENKILTNEICGLVSDEDIDVQILSSYNNFINYLFEKIYNTKNSFFENATGYQDSKNTNDANDEIKEDDLFSKKLSAIAFIHVLNKAASKGMFRKYYEEENNDTKLKGRIDISRHIRINQCIQGKIAYKTREYNNNNSINKLILFTYNFLLRICGSYVKEMLYVSDNENAKKVIIRLATLFPNAGGQTSSGMISNARDKIVNPVYREYEMLRKVCIAILKSKGKSIFYKEKGLHGVIIDTNYFYEKYLTNLMVDKLSDMNITFESPYNKIDNENVNEDTNTRIKKVMISLDEKNKTIVFPSYLNIWMSDYISNLVNQNINERYPDDYLYSKMNCELNKMITISSKTNSSKCIITYPLCYNQNILKNEQQEELIQDIKEFYSKLDIENIKLDVDVNNLDIYAVPLIILEEDYEMFKQVIMISENEVCDLIMKIREY